MSNETTKVIFILLGVAGLALYGYLLFMSDISVENQKYTVIAAALGLLYPAISLSSNELLNENGFKILGVGLLGLCVILIAGYASKIDTEEGVVWDYLNAITTDKYRYFYFLILLVANICPLISKKYSIWISAFVIGIMTPVTIASLLLLLAIILGLSLLGSSGKSNNSSNSWSSIFSSSSNTDTHDKKKSIIQKDNVRRRNFKVIYSHGGPLTYTQHLIDMPEDISFSEIEREIRRMHGNVKVESYEME